jgi:hypothetical protein
MRLAITGNAEPHFDAGRECALAEAEESTFRKLGDLFFRLLKGAGGGAKGDSAMLQDALGGDRCS